MPIEKTGQFAPVKIKLKNFLKNIFSKNLAKVPLP